MHLADVNSYIQADARMMKLRDDPQAWTHKTILNIAASGRFSNDRTTSEYATEIWNLKKRTQ